jgi:hypothetical protein
LHLESKFALNRDEEWVERALGVGAWSTLQRAQRTLGLASEVRTYMTFEVARIREHSLEDTATHLSESVGDDADTNVKPLSPSAHEERGATRRKIVGVSETGVRACVCVYARVGESAIKIKPNSRQQCARAENENE